MSVVTVHSVANESLIQFYLLEDKRLRLIREIDFNDTEKLLNEGFADWANNLNKYVGGELKQAGKDLKLIFTDTKHFMKLAKGAGQLAWKDVKKLANNDPAALALMISEAASMVDPTGAIDLANAVAYYVRGDNFGATISGIVGAMTATGAAISAGTLGAGTGVGVPMIMLAKTLKALKLAKNSSLLLKFVKGMIKYGSTALKWFAKNIKKVPGLKPIQSLINRFLSRVRNFVSTLPKNTEEAIKFITPNFDKIFRQLFGAAQTISKPALKATRSAGKKIAKRAAKARAGLKAAEEVVEKSGKAVALPGMASRAGSAALAAGTLGTAGSSIYRTARVGKFIRNQINNMNKALCKSEDPDDAKRCKNIKFDYDQLRVVGPDPDAEDIALGIISSNIRKFADKEAKKQEKEL